MRGERDLRLRRTQACGCRGEYRVCEQPLPYLAGQAQRAVRHEGDVPRFALGQDVHGALVGQVEQVLHADDLGVVDGAQQMPPGDVAEPDSVDQPFVTGPDQGSELGVEPPARDLRRVHDAQVHRGQLAGAERGEVGLDSLTQVPEGIGHLGHDR
jgi:hypothetical protein